MLGEELVAKNFDTKQTDEFYRWSERRDEYVAEANVSSAKYARDSGMGYTGTGLGGYGSGYGAGYGYGGLGYGAGMGTWAYNPWFGMFTYVPYNGMFYSPFGFGYFSPGLVGSLYMPGSPYYYGGGYTPITTGAVSRNGGSSILTGRTPGVSNTNPGGIYRAGSGISSSGRSASLLGGGGGTSRGSVGGGSSMGGASHAGGGHR